MREAINPDRLAIPLSEAAKLLDVSRSWAETLLKSGRLDGFGIPRQDRTRLYAYHDDVLRLMREQRVDQLEKPDPGPASAETASTRAPAAGQVQAERDHYRAEAAALRETALRLLGANEALMEAHAAQRSAAQHLRAALDDEARASALVQRAAEDQADAVRQFVIPGTPKGIDRLEK